MKTVYLISNNGYAICVATTKEMAELRIELLKAEFRKTAKLLEGELEDNSNYEIEEVSLWTSSSKTWLKNKIKEAE